MRIAVHGDGIAAHLTAWMLAQARQSVIRVPAGTGDHGLGPIGHAVVGLPDWSATQAAAAIGWIPGSALALGLAFAGWGAGNWFLPFGDVGAALDGVPFAQVAARARAGGHEVALADLSLAAWAARMGRFAPPSPDPRSPLSTLAVGVTYPADALCERLERLTRAAGISVADSPHADLHVEAHGASSEAEWESWRDWLPCNRIEARRLSADVPPPPYPLHAAHPRGWHAHAALDGVRCDAIHSVNGAGSPYDNGCRHAPWSGNRVAVGSAAALIEPVLGSALLQLHDDVTRLIDLLPHDPDDTGCEAAEYNRLTRARAQATRDAAVALWATNTRQGEALWDEARDRAPPALERKLALYRSRGLVSIDDDDPLTRSDWTLLLDGQGVRQRRLDPVAAAIPADEASDHYARIRERLAAEARAMPPHAHALARMRAR